MERFKTLDGKEFVIARRPRRGRRYQTPQETGEIISCPYCHGEHEVLCYTVFKGRRHERKVRTWACPTVGKLSINQGRKWDEYVESIIMRRRPGAEMPAPQGVQTSDMPGPVDHRPPRECDALAAAVRGGGEASSADGQRSEHFGEVRPFGQVVRTLRAKGIAPAPRAVLAKYLAGRASDPPESLVQRHLADIREELRPRTRRFSVVRRSPRNHARA